MGRVAEEIKEVVVSALVVVALEAGSPLVSGLHAAINAKRPISIERLMGPSSGAALGPP
jgi:hypothetical protein